MNPGPPGLLRTGKSFTERASPVLYLTELRAPPSMKTDEYEKDSAVQYLYPRVLSLGFLSGVFI